MLMKSKKSFSPSKCFTTGIYLLKINNKNSRVMFKCAQARASLNCYTLQYIAR